MPPAPIPGSDLERCAECTHTAQHVWCEGVAQGFYVWQQYKSKQQPGVSNVRLVGISKAKTERIHAQMRAAMFARDLINMPAEDLGPAEFVRHAKSACRGTGLAVTVFSDVELRKKGAGAITTVGRARHGRRA